MKHLLSWLLALLLFSSCAINAPALKTAINMDKNAYSVKDSFAKRYPLAQLPQSFAIIATGSALLLFRVKAVHIARILPSGKNDSIRHWGYIMGLGKFYQLDFERGDSIYSYMLRRAKRRGNTPSYRVTGRMAEEKPKIIDTKWQELVELYQNFYQGFEEGIFYFLLPEYFDKVRFQGVAEKRGKKYFVLHYAKEKNTSTLYLDTATYLIAYAREVALKRGIKDNTIRVKSYQIIEGVPYPQKLKITPILSVTTSSIALNPTPEQRLSFIPHIKEVEARAKRYKDSTKRR